MIRFAKYALSLIVAIFLCLSINAQDKEKVKKCFAIIEIGKQDTVLVRAYNELASEFLGSTDEKAKQYAILGLNLSDKLNNKYLQSWSLNLIGLSFDYMGKPDSALLHYQKAIAIKKQINDVDGLGSVYMNIGVMYYYQNNIEKAIEYYNQAMTFFKEANNQKRIAGILNNIGIIYRQEKKYSKAIETFEKAFEIKSNTKDTAGMANALGNMGVVYQNMGDYKKAELFHLKSMRLDSLTSNSYNLVSSFVSLAELYFYNKNYSEVKNNLDKAIEIGNKINAIHYLDDIYLLYTKLDSTIGDNAMAYIHLKKFNYYNDKILKDDRLKQMDKLETIFSVKEKEAQINLLNANGQIKQLKINQQYKQILIFSVSSIVLISLLIIVALSYRRIKHQRKELQVKNNIIEDALQEKEILLKEIHHRVKNNLQVISSLLNLQSRYIKDETALNAINESKERINAISVLHKEIYQNEVLKLIDAKNYFTNLALNLQNTFDPKKNCELQLNIEELFLDIDTLIPLGLIVNELITNAYKYGSSQLNPIINFTVSVNNKIITLIINDNGKGFDSNFNSEATNSAGTKLISLFAKKIMANVVYSNNGGACITITFNLKNE